MKIRNRFFREFLRNRMAVAGLVFLFVIITMALFADLIFPSGSDMIDLDNSLRSPSPGHPFGTDSFGRDLLARVVFGARISLGVGFLARTISLLLGLLLGTLAGYFGGRTDSVIMRMADITFAFPALLLLIAIMAVVSPGMISLFTALGAIGWASVARLVRAQVMSVKDREYVQAAKAAGAGDLKLVWSYILPQCISPVIVIYTLGLGITVMAEASLSFLGLGVQPPAPSWGRMISTGIVFMRSAPWLTLFPGLVLTATICSLNLVGDGIRDALDPRSSAVVFKPAAAAVIFNDGFQPGLD
ncbi:MAG: ABC transporter permease [Candidatus Krumholzibacteriota bacterium]|nr:ABC transporter permease [Candidatus Krumholzibacteriota bacterium]